VRNTGRVVAGAVDADRAWARGTVGGVGGLEGEIVAFGDGQVTVALASPVPGATGRAAILTLGVGRHQESGVWADVVAAATTSDGRPCLVLRLVERRGGGRREVERVPFAAKVDVLVVSGRRNGDAHVRGVAVDLSARGLGVQLDRDLPPGTTVLLRFPVPPNRGAVVQVRGSVVSCRPDEHGASVHGIAFERVSGTVSQQLQAALRALTRGH
jgi:PilZ domain